MLTTTADPDEPHRMIEPWSRLRVLVSPLESTPSDRHPGSLATKSVITHRQSEVSIALCQISPALFAPSPDCNRDSSSSTTSSFATATAAALRYSRHTTRLRETPTEAPDTADLPTQALAGTKRTREPSPVAHSPSSGQHLSAMSSSKRGRKRNDNLPPNRARDVQRAFRARRAAHLQALEARVDELEDENDRLRAMLNMPPAARPQLGKGPTGKDRPKQYDSRGQVIEEYDIMEGNIGMPSAGPSGHHSSSPSSSSTRPVSHSPPGGHHTQQLSPETPLHTPLDEASIATHSGSGSWGELVAHSDGMEVKPLVSYQHGHGGYPQPSPVSNYGTSPISPYGQPPPETPMSATASSAPPTTTSYQHQGSTAPSYIGGGHMEKPPSYSYGAPQRHSQSGTNSIYALQTPSYAAQQTHDQNVHAAYTSQGYLEASHTYASSSPASHEHGGMPSIPQQHSNGRDGSHDTTPTQTPGMHGHSMLYSQRRSVTDPYAHAHAMRNLSTGYMGPPPPITGMHSSGHLEQLRPSPPHAHAHPADTRLR